MDTNLGDCSVPLKGADKYEVNCIESKTIICLKKNNESRTYVKLRRLFPLLEAGSVE